MGVFVNRKSYIKKITNIFSFAVINLKGKTYMLIINSAIFLCVMPDLEIKTNDIFMTPAFFNGNVMQMVSSLALNG